MGGLLLVAGTRCKAGMRHVAAAANGNDVRARDTAADRAPGDRCTRQTMQCMSRNGRVVRHAPVSDRCCSMPAIDLWEIFSLGGSTVGGTLIARPWA